MADISITNTNKNNLTITNRTKPAGKTWNDAAETWDDANYSWDSPREILTKTTKNNLTVTPRNKN